MGYARHIYGAGSENKHVISPWAVVRGHFKLRVKHLTRSLLAIYITNKLRFIPDPRRFSKEFNRKRACDDKINILYRYWFGFFCSPAGYIYIYIYTYINIVKT